jgi:hypothetical protein
MDELGPTRVIDPQRASAESAKAAFSGADLRVVSVLTFPHPGLVNRDVLLTLDLQGSGEGTEVDRVASTAGRLAADGAVANQVWIR